MELSVVEQPDSPPGLQQSPGMALPFDLPNLGRSQLACGTPESKTLPTRDEKLCLPINSDKRPLITENHRNANNKSQLLRNSLSNGEGR